MKVTANKHPKDDDVIELYAHFDKKDYLVGTIHAEWFIADDFQERLEDGETVNLKIEEDTDCQK